jgi:hypothetical protein
MVQVPEKFIGLIDSVQAARGSYTRADAMGYILDCVKKHPEILGLAELMQEIKTEVSDAQGTCA